MALKELMTQLIDMEAEASINLDEVDPKVRVGAEGRQRAAQSAVAQLRNQYLSEIVNHAFIIAVKGPGSEEFGRLSSEKFDTIAVDYKFLTKRLVRALRSRRASDMYNQTEHWMMLTELQQLKLEYDIISLPAPGLSALSSYYQRPLEEAVENLLRDTYGNRLVTAVLRREIGQQALSKKFQGTKLPVVIYNFDQPIDSGLDLTILTRPVALVNTTSEVTEESTKRELIKVRDKLTPKKRIRDRRKKKPAAETAAQAEIIPTTETSNTESK